MKPVLDKRIAGLVQLLNGDISIETARLLAGRVYLTPVLPDDLTNEQIEDLTDEQIEDLTEKQVVAASIAMFKPMVKHRDTLRTLVDEWIDSGIQADGSEQPRSRRLSDPSESRIWQVVDSYQKRHHMFVQLQADGGTLAVFAAEGADEPSMPGMEVVRVFIQFFDSPWIFRLMRCARCRTYQLVNAPRKSYIQGWHCAECRKTAAATRCVSKARADERERKLQACAAAWAKGEPKHADRHAWVLEQANKQLSYSERLKRNFIARNLAEIQARAERMHNAKG